MPRKEAMTLNFNPTEATLDDVVTAVKANTDILVEDVMDVLNESFEESRKIKWGMTNLTGKDLDDEYV